MKHFMILKRIKNKVSRIRHSNYLKLLKLFYGLEQINLESIVKNDIKIKKPIMQDICLSPYCPYSQHDDYIPLMKIVKYYSPSLVLEFGTAHGNTVANICNHVENSKVITVNALPENISGTEITYKLNTNEIGRVYKKYGFSNRVKQIYSNTLDINLEEHLENKLFDMAIIDACHDTDFVINDFFKVEPYVKMNGIILLHDTHPNMKNHLEGSYKACMKLKTLGYNISYIKNTWWGIYIKNNTI